MIDYKLIRTNRKSLAIQIHHGALIARAPKHMPVSAIEAFILKKQSWIEKHLKESDAFRQSLEANPGFLPGYGDTILFLGKECPIKGSPAMDTGKPNRYRGEYEDGVFVIGQNLKPHEIKFILTQIYKREAKKYLPARVEHYGNKMSLSPESVKITTAFGRWGSCGAKKRLNFAWMLMMADPAAIDSVVVHELSHMIRMNHSKAFYAIVYKYCPDYDARHKRLHQVSQRAQNEHWK